MKSLVECVYVRLPVKYRWGDSGIVRLKDGIAALQVGDLSGRVLLYCHGNGEDCCSSRQLFEELAAQSISVLAVDYRGYGLSGGQFSEKGHPAAQHNLAVCYQEGCGVKKDLEEAFRWMVKSAEQGFADAENKVGVMYMDGKGVAKKVYLARYWFDRAMSKGNSWAPYDLGILYQDGRLGPVNMSEARRLYKLAESRGCTDAAKKLAEIGR